MFKVVNNEEEGKVRRSPLARDSELNLIASRPQAQSRELELEDRP